MGFLINLIVGAIIGAIAGAIEHTNTSLWVNIIIGLVGSALGRWIFGGLFGLDSGYAAGTFSLAGFFYGVIGSVILIVIARLLKINL